jgi:O-antigen ligase
VKYNAAVVKKYSIDKIFTLLLSAIIFLVPTNLFLTFEKSNAYVNGLLVDYLIPKIYLGDIFIFSILGVWLIEIISKKKQFRISKAYFPSILFSFLIIRQAFTFFPLAAIWYLLKLFEIGLLSWFLFTHKKLLKKSAIFITIIVTAWFQSLLAIYQFVTQRSLLGYKFFGEPNLAQSIGLAKDMWWNTGRVLPYGTTAHPNILGGILAICGLVILKKLPAIKNGWGKLLSFFTMAIVIIVLVLTQSISAGLTFVIGLVFINRKNVNQRLIIISAVTMIVIAPISIHLLAKPFHQTNSFVRRSYLQTAAVKMFLDQPIFGVGLNQFTARVEEYSKAQEIVRFIQPVHHLGLLWLAETGLLGLILLAWVLLKTSLAKKITPLIILLPIMVLDHYLFTQQAGLLLLAFTPLLRE